jgi:hypothetical protein
MLSLKEINDAQDIADLQTLENLGLLHRTATGYEAVHKLITEYLFETFGIDENT